ncbi:unnamed protein product [Colias eurytheme]|nr:unnamed protein product [Colias eurytheme]
MCRHPTRSAEKCVSKLTVEIRRLIEDISDTGAIKRRERRVEARRTIKPKAIKFTHVRPQTEQNSHLPSDSALTCKTNKQTVIESTKSILKLRTAFHNRLSRASFVLQLM